MWSAENTEQNNSEHVPAHFNALDYNNQCGREKPGVVVKCVFNAKWTQQWIPVEAFIIKPSSWDSDQLHCVWHNQFPWPRCQGLCFLSKNQWAFGLVPSWLLFEETLFISLALQKRTLSNCLNLTSMCNLEPPRGSNICLLLLVAGCMSCGVSH